MWKKLGHFLSVCYVFGAICLLITVCCHCYPGVEAWGKKVIAGREDSPVRAAFSVLSDSLMQGDDLQDSLAASYEALTGETSAN